MTPQELMQKAQEILNSKSTDELDAMLRHMIEGEWDAVAWRALANCEREAIKKEQGE